MNQEPIQEQEVKKKKKEQPIVRPVTPRNKIGRNQKCPCGSGKKFKKCCLK